MIGVKRSHDKNYSKVHLLWNWHSQINKVNCGYFFCVLPVVVKLCYWTHELKNIGLYWIPLQFLKPTSIYLSSSRCKTTVFLPLISFIAESSDFFYLDIKPRVLTTPSWDLETDNDSGGSGEGTTTAPTTGYSSTTRATSAGTEDSSRGGTPPTTIDHLSTTSQRSTTKIPKSFTRDHENSRPHPTTTGIFSGSIWRFFKIRRQYLGSILEMGRTNEI